MLRVAAHGRHLIDAEWPPVKRMSYDRLVLLGLAALLLTLLASVLPGTLRADMGGGGDSAKSSRDPNYVKAAELIKKEQYAQAVPLLEQVLAKNGKDADAYNLLGFSHRKLGKLEQALAYYDKALSIDPKHRGAHEYRGEAYLELGQLDKAKQDLAFLNSDCWLGCEEYTDLKEAVAKYEAKRR
jgi:tetratricopeptide (TPR) repeat protein